MSTIDLKGENPIEYFRRMCLTDSLCPKYKVKKDFAYESILISF
jgi:hypothetical protein